MTAWVREEKKMPENRQRRRAGEKEGKVEVAPGVTVGSLRRFRAALIGPTQELPKRRWLGQQGSLRIRSVRCCRWNAFFVCTGEVVAIRGGHGGRLAADGISNPL